MDSRDRRTIGMPNNNINPLVEALKEIDLVHLSLLQNVGFKVQTNYERYKDDWNTTTER